MNNFTGLNFNYFNMFIGFNFGDNLLTCNKKNVIAKISFQVVVRAEWSLEPLETTLKGLVDHRLKIKIKRLWPGVSCEQNCDWSKKIGVGCKSLYRHTNFRQSCNFIVQLERLPPRHMLRTADCFNDWSFESFTDVAGRKIEGRIHYTSQRNIFICSRK